MPISMRKEFSKKKVTKTELAALVGTSLSKRVKGKKINKIYFDDLDTTVELSL